MICFIFFSCKEQALKNKVTCPIVIDNMAEKVYRDSIISVKSLPMDSFYLVPPYYPLNEVGKMFNCQFICNDNYVPADYFMLFHPDKRQSKAILINVGLNNFGVYSLKDSTKIFSGIFIKKGNLYKKQ